MGHRQAAVLLPRHWCHHGCSRRGTRVPCMGLGGQEGWWWCRARACISVGVGCRWVGGGGRVGGCYAPWLAHPRMHPPPPLHRSLQACPLWLPGPVSSGGVGVRRGGGSRAAHRLRRRQRGASVWPRLLGDRLPPCSPRLWHASGWLCVPVGRSVACRRALAGLVIGVRGWQSSMLRSYHPEHTGSHQNSEVKLDWAGLVLC